MCGSSGRSANNLHIFFFLSSFFPLHTLTVSVGFLVHRCCVADKRSFFFSARLLALTVENNSTANNCSNKCEMESLHRVQNEFLCGAAENPSGNDVALTIPRSIYSSINTGTRVCAGVKCKYSREHVPFPIVSAHIIFPVVFIYH